jgi:hypothetical protein
MTTHAKRTDDNQALIVQALRRAGASVEHLHTLGRGCPDLLIGFRGENYLLEVKNGLASPSHRLLTSREKAWHQTWRGSVKTVATIHEALVAVGAVEADRGRV